MSDYTSEEIEEVYRKQREYKERCMPLHNRRSQYGGYPKKYPFPVEVVNDFTKMAAIWGRLFDNRQKRPY